MSYTIIVTRDDTEIDRFTIDGISSAEELAARAAAGLEERRRKYNDPTLQGYPIETALLSAA